MSVLPPPADSGPDGDDDPGRGRPGAAGGRDASGGRTPSAAAGDAYPDLPPLDVVVPDDLSELAAEVEAFRREQQQRRRQARLHRMVFTRRWARYGLSGPVVVAALLLVGALGALMTVFAPSPGAPRLASRPLARTSVADGSRGGLVPDVALQSGPRTVSTHDPVLRPGVLVVVPRGCVACAPLVDDVVAQAREVRLTTTLVAPPLPPAQLDALSRAGHGLAYVDVDPQGRLLQVLNASRTQPTVVVVGADGVLAADPVPFTAGLRLEPTLERVGLR